MIFQSALTTIDRRLIGWQKSSEQAGTVKRDVKARDAGRILAGEDLSVAIDKCPELKAFVDTIVTICRPKSQTVGSPEVQCGSRSGR